MQMTGTLYGIGVGPGDPDLLTLKAVTRLRECAIVAYPEADGRPSLALSIAAPHLSNEIIRYPYTLPIAHALAPGQAAYDLLADKLAEDLDQGHNVAVLCEGDPLFYGSFAEVMTRLSPRYPVEVVPGITSSHAAAAVVCQPMVQRNASWSVLPATLPNEELACKLAQTDAAALLKVGRQLGRVRRLLYQLDLLDRAIYAERVSQPDARMMPLAKMLDETAPYFSLIFIGMKPE
jgi:precorrin-2/cobalt-factor-2 C20-methyltransferase